MNVYAMISGSELKGINMNKKIKLMKKVINFSDYCMIVKELKVVADFLPCRWF